jgi:hypothetical protein
MRILIEICLTLCEWFQECSIQRSARRAARASERKTVFTFLSQGAVGGMVGYFLLIAISVVIYPNGYNFLYLIVLPLLLALGAASGSISAGFVWLPGLLLKRRLKFPARLALVIGGMTIVSVMISHMTKPPPDEQWPLSWRAGFVCIMYLPIVLMTGSRIRPVRLIFLGAGPLSRRHNFGSWLAFPAGALLRAASVFALFEASLTMAIWISARRSKWQTWPAPEHQSAIVMAVLYFAASTYFSIRPPRKLFLLPIAILLNLPLALLIVNLKNLNTSDSTFMSYLLLPFICLWAVFTLGRLIAPELARRVSDSSRKDANAWKASPGGICRVQL